LEAYSDQVRDVVAEVGGQSERPAVIVGHSMGGQVAELVAQAESTDLLGLVLIVPAPLRGYPLSVEQFEAFAQRAQAKDPGAIAEGKTAMAVSLDRKGLERLVDATIATPAADALAALNAWTGGHPTGNDSSRVTAPTLVVSSDDQFFTRPLLENDVASRFPNVELAAVPGTGHWPHVEAPRAVAEILDRFIDANSQRPTPRREPHPLGTPMRCYHNTQ
jgi:pimeloyl-ACP methyl ester carboxylesterase